MEGGPKYGKIFFAFLDELDHLEAEKNINFLVETQGHLDPPPPLTGKVSTKTYFFFMPSLRIP